MTREEENIRERTADKLESDYLITLAREGTMTGAAARSVASIARQAFIAGWNARAELKEGS